MLSLKSSEDSTERRTTRQNLALKSIAPMTETSNQLKSSVSAKVICKVPHAFIIAFPIISWLNICAMYLMH